MKEVLDEAVIHEIWRELSMHFPTMDFPRIRQVQRPDRLEFAYPAETAYRVSINVRDDAKLESALARIPYHALGKGCYPLSDPTLFASIARNVFIQVRKDRVLVRVLSRVGRELHDKLVQAINVPDDWHVSFYGPGVHGDYATTSATLQPLGLRFACPEISYVLILKADRIGKYEAKIDMKCGRQSAMCSSTYWKISDPEALSERQWTAADLPYVAMIAVRHIERFVHDRTLPFESVYASRQARQAMMVATPLRLAENAAKTGETPWCRELTDACLLNLSRQTETPGRVLRQLFFTLMKLLLADQGQQSNVYSDYKRLGLILARMRYVDETLPYNPVLAYDRLRSGKPNLDDKLSKQDRETYSWFLEKASLEQIADLMSLP